ncbi:MAG: desulfoferrodoxin [Candidatus Brocadiales bacterium]|nr:desulfoferrodoxin [Candidatus Brocadiales bacterium]
MERAGRDCKCRVCGTEIKITTDCGGILKCCDQPMAVE